MTDSLSSWDKVILNSIQGVCDDESFATTIPSVSSITEPAISHPQAGSDPELIQLQEHSMPRAAPKLAAAPSTPPASIPKAPMAVPTSPFATTSFPIERTDSTVTVPDYGGPKKKKEAEAIIIDKWPQPTEFRSWKFIFKSEVSQSSQYPIAAVLWIGETEDAESIDGLVISASK